MREPRREKDHIALFREEGSLMMKWSFGLRLWIDGVDVHRLTSSRVHENDRAQTDRSIGIVSARNGRALMHMSEMWCVRRVDGSPKYKTRVSHKFLTIIGVLADLHGLIHCGSFEHFS